MTLLTADRPAETPSAFRPAATSAYTVISEADVAAFNDQRFQPPAYDSNLSKGHGYAVPDRYAAMV